MLRAWLCGFIVLSGSCTAVVRIDQCSIDADCQHLAPMGSTAYFCTSDHICINETPAEDISCAVDKASAPSDPNDVTIGGLFDYAHDLALLQAARLAIEEINKLGRRPLRFVTCDTQGQPIRARSALRVLATQYRAVGVLGPSTTEEVKGVFDVAKTDKVVVLTTNAGADDIDTLDDGGFVWRLRPGDTMQGRVLAALVPATTAHVGVAFRDNPYGSSQLVAIEDQLSLNKLPSATSQAIADTDGDGQANDQQAAAFVRMGPALDTAIFASDGNVVAWVKQLSLGMQPALKNLLLTEAARTTDLLNIPNDGLLNLISLAANGMGTGPNVAAFLMAYSARWGTPASPAAARAYDGVYSLALAASILSPTGHGFGDGVRQGMQRLYQDLQETYDTGPAHYQLAYDAMFNDGVTIDLNGVSGPIDFDKDGDVKTGPIDVWTIDTTKPAAPVYKLSTTITP
jgi:branched-chain amino acid transport system substrate-binding protein